MDVEKSRPLAVQSVSAVKRFTRLLTLAGIHEACLGQGRAEASYAEREDIVRARPHYRECVRPVEKKLQLKVPTTVLSVATYLQYRLPIDSP